MGRARARREAAAALFDTLSPDQRNKLQGFLVNDVAVGQTRLTWLRGLPHSTSPASMTALLDRLKYLRALDFPPNLGQCLHSNRSIKFAREGLVAPVPPRDDSFVRRPSNMNLAPNLSNTIGLFEVGCSTKA